MKKISWLLILSLLAVVSLVGCGSENASQPSADATKSKTEIMVSAAASLKDSLTELQKNYEQKNSNVKLTINYASSGTLQKQIENGAPTDVFISAGEKQMDALDKENLISKDTRVNLLGNDLVLVTGKDNDKITSPEDLTNSSVSKVSIGTPESVPAGQYAKEALTSLKLWDPLQSKLVLAKDVTQVLNYVETGNVDAGFVYRSDAQISTKVKVVTALPDSSHKPIVYPAAVISATKNAQTAGDFLKYLQSDEAQKVFAKYGFKSATK